MPKSVYAMLPKFKFGTKRIHSKHHFARILRAKAKRMR